MKCLNPYFNGKYFLSLVLGKFDASLLPCLNPYFNGKYFLSLEYANFKTLDYVLILILMENTF